ncbi:choline dehydrogenase-like flavoprotein [Nocardia transvalensis]|uniref:Choline dehydrogenase-like flavoprotein n=1 Tax=Nocardia transvalensis TaxID=37333 RepID=A0A7W9PF49_9NOCA|nr:GMC family oxidoreductase [Nocardia transvalensis]MBB5915024.1 choline dehydrogenase-like flavoprotein [Nocardia transvalensis]
MRIDDLREVRDTELDADICIVGSGPAGLTIATELAGTAWRVLVLESGGRTRSPDADRLNDIENAGAPRAMPHRDARNRVLGGSSDTWSGRCGYFDEIDFSCRPWVPESGWPIGAADVRPYLDRAARHIGIGYGGGFNNDAFWRLAHRPRPSRTADPDLLRPYFWQISKDPANPFDAKRFGAHAAATPAPNVRVVVNATVTQVRTDESGSRVESLEVAGADPRRRTVRARWVVLAAGGIENARLLLASRRDVPHGVGNGNGLVGRYLMDHRSGAVGTFDPAGSPAVRDHYGKYVVRSAHGTHTFLHGLALSDRIQRDERLLNCALWIQEVPADDDPWDAVKRLMRLRGDRHDARRALGSSGLLLSGAYRRLVHHTGLPHRLDRVELRCMVEQRPDPASRVTLAEHSDRFGVPVARLEWKTSELEDRTVRRAAGLVAAEFARLGYAAPTLCEWARPGSSAPPQLTDWAHPTGTTRMSADPRHGVVDPACRVHEVENLYVAGSSVFPTTGHVNPTLMILALAVRLADGLKAGSTTVGTSPAQAS